MDNTDSDSDLTTEQVLKLEQFGSEVGPFLPWHEVQDPFKILTTEILLRRTARRNVLKVWGQFTDEYYSPKRILNAKNREIRSLVEVLGLYNQRVKVLNEVSEDIMERFGGKVPSGKEDLISIPHVGSYISEAVLLYSFEKKYLPLDSGVQRVLHRICGSNSFKEYSPYKDDLCTNAASFITRFFSHRKCINTHRSLLWIVWEKCTYQSPKCKSCPVLNVCVSGQDNTYLEE